MPIGSKGLAMIDARDTGEIAAIELIRRDIARFVLDQLRADAWLHCSPLITWRKQPLHRSNSPFGAGHDDGPSWPGRERPERPRPGPFYFAWGCFRYFVFRTQGRPVPG
jgi:hypothetical protein